jgi:hypothetical protein
MLKEHSDAPDSGQRGRAAGFMSFFARVLPSRVKTLWQRVAKLAYRIDPIEAA